MTTGQPIARAGAHLRVIIAFGNDVAVDALGFLGEPFDEAAAIDDLAHGFGQGLALLHSHEPREIVLVSHDEIEPSAQNGGAFLAGLGPPCRPGLIGGDDSAPRFIGAHIGHGAELCAGRRIGHIEGLLGVGVDPFTVDITLWRNSFASFRSMTISWRRF